MSEGAPERRRKRLGPWRIGLLTAAALLLLALGLLAGKITTPPAPFPIPPDLALAYPQEKFDSDDNAFHLYWELPDITERARNALHLEQWTTADLKWYGAPAAQWSAEDIQLAEQWTTAYASALQAFREATAKPYFMERKNDAASLLPYMSTVRDLTHASTASAILALRRGDEPAAVDALTPPLRAAAHLTQHGPVIGRLTAGAVESIVFRCVLDALNSGSLHSASPLRRLAEELKSLEQRRAPLADTLRVEYDYAHRTIEQWARRGSDGVHEAIQSLVSSESSDTDQTVATLSAWWELHLSYPRSLRALTEQYQVQVRGLEADPVAAIHAEIASRHGARTQMTGMLSQQFAMWGWKFAEKEAQLNAQRRGIAIALAAARYRLEHGEFPPDLAALAPKYLTAMPLDPYDGLPLKVRREPDVFVIWSIGDDFTDQGGRIALQSRDQFSGKKGDQVWRLEAPK